MIGVVAPAGLYAAALAELPLSTRAVDDAQGAVVVVPGTAGWAEAVLAAASDGAIAVIVARPDVASAADIHRIASVAGIPVIIERPLLRPDATSDAVAARAGGAAPRLLVADAAASRARLPAVARDSIGWLRVLAGDGLSFVAADAGLALLETRLGIAATLTVVATRRPGAGLIRVHALGEITTEVEVEGRATRVVTASSTGRLISPTRFESSERLALRRAVGAIEGGTSPEDLGELLADTILAEQVLVSAP